MTLLLLHGFLGAPESWDPVRHALAYPGPVLAPTLFGHGRPPRAVPSSFWAAVDALSMGLEQPAFVAGYSFGGRLALGLACRHPARVRGVVAIGAHPGLRSPVERRQRRAWEEELAGRLETHGLSAFVETWERLPLFSTQAGLPEPVLARQRQLRLAHDPRALARALRVLGTGSMPELAIGRSRAPLLLVTGEHDASHASTLSGKTLPGVGHNPLLEAPRLVARVLDEQLAAWSEIRTLENPA